MALCKIEASRKYKIVLLKPPKVHSKFIILCFPKLFSTSLKVFPFFFIFSGMAIALAHGGKTREELAKELASIDGGGESDDTSGPKSPMPKLAKSTNFFVEAKAPEGIMLTPLKECPGATLRCHLGLLNQFLIRETSSLREVRSKSITIKVTNHNHDL